jgi:hypothetical protein
MRGTRVRSIREILVDVTRGAAKPEHRVFFHGLEFRAANHVRVFVGLEVGQADDDRLRGEGGAQCGDAFGELVDVEPSPDLRSRRWRSIRLRTSVRHVVVVQCRLGVDADGVVDDEFEARETDTEVGQSGEIECERSGLPTFIMILKGSSGMSSSATG